MSALNPSDEITTATHIDDCGVVRRSEAAKNQAQGHQGVDAQMQATDIRPFMDQIRVHIADLVAAIDEGKVEG